MRYIDADKFIAELEQEKTVALEFEDGVAVYEIEHTMNLIGMQPTADVVPKSEVERLQEQIERLQGRNNFLEIEYKNQGNLFWARVNGVKAEVAREIFEEIERLITKECLVFKDENGIRGYVDASVHYAISELKKKYTE